MAATARLKPGASSGSPTMWVQGPKCLDHLQLLFPFHALSGELDRKRSSQVMNQCLLPQTAALPYRATIPASTYVFSSWKSDHFWLIFFIFHCNLIHKFSQMILWFMLGRHLNFYYYLFICKYLKYSYIYYLFNADCDLTFPRLIDQTIKRDMGLFPIFQISLVGTQFSIYWPQMTNSALSPFMPFCNNPKVSVSLMRQNEKHCW